jgi:glycosyltransferase involved in cell wall biosynthesis
MRIAFVTGGIELGKTGVGDYTRVLAAGCVTRGHAAAIVAIADDLVRERVVEHCDGVDVLRLPTRLPAADRKLAAAEFLATFAADVISLQFVAYSFDTRGLVHDIDALLPRPRGVPFAVMMHELWVGAERGASWKDRVLGRAQRHFIARLLARLAPVAIHTSTPAYVARLRQAGFVGKVLPMLSTIPIVADEVARAADTWRGVLFGAVYREWQPDALFAQLAAAAHGRRVVIASLGNLGAGRAHWDAIAARHAHRLTFETLGERAPADISRALAAADFGLSTSPWLLVGKSAAAATMIAHGLPVLVTRDDVHYEGVFADSRSPRTHLVTPQLRFESLVRAAPDPHVNDAIIAAFLADLAS